MQSILSGSEGGEAARGRAGKLQFEEELSGRCLLCLSAERTLSCARDASWAYGVLMQQDQAAGEDGEEARVCWECAAELRRMLRFKRRALRARELLERARAQLAHALHISLPCLSRLATATKSAYDYTVWSEAETVDCKDVNISADVVYADLPIESSVDQAEIVPKVENDSEAGDIWAEPEEIPIKYEAPVETKSARRKRKPKATKETKGRVVEPGGLDVEYEMLYESREDVLRRREMRLQSVQPAHRRFECATCAELFRTERRLAAHNRRLHCKNADALTCDTCLCRLPSVAALATHRVSHERYKCDLCQFTSPSVVKLRRHRETHERIQQRETSHSCEVCGKQFKNKQTYTVHYKLHASEQPYECDHCHKVYKTRIQIFRHLKSHKKRWLCDLCGKAFSNKTYLNLHSYAHADPSERKFECPECHNRFIDKFKLIVHMRSHTGEKPFKCDDCGKVFREKAQLVGHRRKHHSDKSCGVLKEKRTLERTKSAHRNKPYLVESKEKNNMSECAKDLMENVGMSHKKGKMKTDYSCNFCGKKFKEGFRLKFHLAVHSDERPHKCSECGMNFKYQSGLWTHKLLHKGEKHQCTICGSLFTQKGNLTAHLKIHTDDKPFECNVCGNKFRTRRNLRNHFKVHSSGTAN